LPVAQRQGERHHGNGRHGRRDAANDFPHRAHRPARRTTIRASPRCAAPPENPLKWIIVVAFILIIGSLASAMFFLIRDRGRTRNTARALGFRVGFSIALFLLILFANRMGWIESTGVPITRNAPR